VNLAAIREKRAAKVAEMRTLLAKAETEKRALAQPEQTAFDALKAEVQDLEGQEARAQFLEDAERRTMGQPVDRSEQALHLAVNVVEVMRAQMEGRSLTGAAAEYQAETERRTGRKAQGVFVPLAALEKRVTTSGTAGEIVPTMHRADQYIEPFRNSLLARKLGVRVLSGLTGNVSIPKFGSGTTTGWVAENAALTPSDMTFDSVTLAPKHAGGMTEMSRQLLQQSSPDIEQLVRDDLSFMLAKAIDSALIKGGGTNEPDGVMSTTGIQTATLTALSNWWQELVDMMTQAEMQNAAPNAWLTSPHVRAVIAKLLDGDGHPLNLLKDGKLMDLPFFSTNQVPLNATPTPDTGQLILGDFRQVMLGIWSEVDILVNPYAETAYSKGNVLVRAMSTVDIAVRHPEAFVVSTDITV
jgi:HK97 family phage major capsid protein